MANEITTSVSLKFEKSSRIADLKFGGVTVDVSGTKYVQNVQSVGVSEEMLDIGDIGTPGLVIAKNHDATGVISLRPSSGANDCIDIKAGEVALFRLATATPYVIADSESLLEYLVVED